MTTPATSGTFRTALEDMAIGDCIPCRYTAKTSGTAGNFSELGICTAAEIPVAGSATPDGRFYFIKVDTGLLISDRVVQNAISWNTLNTAKYIQGAPLNALMPYAFNMTSNTSALYQASASMEYATGQQAYRAFNGIISSDYDTSWVANPSDDHSWLAIKSLTKKLRVNGYRITIPPSYASRAPKNWMLYGRNGTNEWIAIDQQTNTSWYTVTKTFILTDEALYEEYKIDITDNTASGTTDKFVGVAEMELLYSTGAKSVFVRSLTGGVAYLGTNGSASTVNTKLGAWPSNNEWDEYVVKSTLGGKIAAGDDNVWHWSNCGSWTQDTPILNLKDVTGANTATSGYRVFRGYNDSYGSIKRFNVDASSYSTGTPGFRPVIEYMEPNCKASNMYY